MTSQRVLPVGNVAGGSKPAAFITAAEPLTRYQSSPGFRSVEHQLVPTCWYTYTPEQGLTHVRCSDGSGSRIPLAFTPYAPGLPDDERTLMIWDEALMAQRLVPVLA